MYAYSKDWAEASQPEHFRPGEALEGADSEMFGVIEQNKRYRQYIAELDRGKPGHYYGREVMFEGSIPTVAFYMAAEEFGGDENWYQNDQQFEDYMKRHPYWDWRNG